MSRRLCAIAAAMVLAGYARAQAPPQFEVASVKPHPPADPDVHIGPHPGGFEAVGVSLKLLIQVAYRLKEYQISGGPGWIDSERYDILARASAGVNPAPAQLSAMLQTLLAERFHLRIHHETKELPAFALIVNKGGPKLKPTAGDEPRISVGRGLLSGTGLSMAGLADTLGRESDRAIIDRTNLQGEYDLTLKWNPELSDQNTSGVSLVTAVQEQLGLKLEQTKTGVDVLVIDSAEKASRN